MSEITIPVRELKVFQTDNGMRVERWSKVSEVKKQAEEGEESDYRTETDLFVGVVQILTNQGPKELKYEIKASSIDEAFKNYVPFARAAIETHQKQMQEFIRQQQLQEEEQENQIVTAPAEALRAIDKIQKQRSEGGLLIP